MCRASERSQEFLLAINKKIIKPKRYYMIIEVCVTQIDLIVGYCLHVHSYAFVLSEATFERERKRKRDASEVLST